MKNNISRITILVIAIISLGSCSRVLIKSNPQATPTICFNTLWQTMNNKYSFFTYKNVNWDSIKTVYAPQVNDNMTDAELFALLSKVIGSVRDGHTSIYAPMDTFKYIFYDGFASNFDSTFVKNKYWLANNFKQLETINYGILGANIGYIHYPSFSNDLTLKNMDKIFTELANTKGLIIDVRNNTGGSADNIYRLAEHLVNTNTILGNIIEKKDGAPNSFTTETIINIAPKGVLYSKPIIILTNRLVYSSANIFTGFVSQLSNVKLIGDFTGGGTGVPTSNDLPNGWRFRFSSTEIKLANGTRFEDGLQPTIKATTDSASQVITGKDAIIEKAILELQ